jgi:hypothetical protein
VNFVYFNSKRVGINLDNVEWYAIRDSGEVAIHLASGMEFFIQDSDEVDYFLSFSTDLEFDDETEEN